MLSHVNVSYYCRQQQDTARERAAVHGLHVEAPAGHHHPVVRGLEPLQAPARGRGQV